MSQHLQCLDASRPWLVFWNVHALALLGHCVDAALSSKIVAFLRSCRTAEGGYAGGPGQLAHLAPTYAAVMALCELATDEALASIDRLVPQPI